MAVEKQSRTVPKVRISVEWPELPDDISDRNALEKWYYDMRNSVDNELDKLAQAVNE